MSAFNGLKLTNLGLALQAKVQSGAELHFTRMAMGDGDLGSSTIASLTTLKNQVKSLGITKVKSLSGGKAVVGTVFSNSTITTGFYWREVGIFAQDPDVGEILYMYANSGAAAEYIPANGGLDIINRSVDVVLIVGNATTVSATIDESLVYATQQDIQNLQEQIDAIVVTDTQVSLDATQVPAAVNNAGGKLSQLLSFITNRIIAITGKTFWWEMPAINLQSLSQHTASTYAHSATSSAMPSQIIMRDAAGRAKIATPATDDDIARKDTVDNHANKTTEAHGGIVASSDVAIAASPNKILKLDGNGKLPASITGDAATLGGKSSSGYMQGSVSGSYSMGNSPALSSGASYTFVIPLGQAVKYGWVTLYNSYGSARIHFTNISGCFTCDQQTSSYKAIVANPENTFLPGVMNYPLFLLYSGQVMSLMDCYVSGTNLYIVVENHTGYNNTTTLAFSGKWAGVY